MYFFDEAQCQRFATAPVVVPFSVVEFNVRVPEGCVQPLNTCCHGFMPAIGGLQLVSSGLSWVGKYILH